MPQRKGVAVHDAGAHGACVFLFRDGVHKFGDAVFLILHHQHILRFCHGIEPEGAEHAVIFGLCIKEKVPDALLPCIADKLADHGGGSARTLGGRVNGNVLEHTPVKAACGNDFSVILPQGDIVIRRTLHGEAAA